MRIATLSGVLTASFQYENRISSLLSRTGSERGSWKSTKCGLVTEADDNKPMCSNLNCCLGACFMVLPLMFNGKTIMDNDHAL